jgi:phenylpropionate dioxygenase-like ring-hydroxylating dioxygenase large terminal subunit
MKETVFFIKPPIDQTNGKKDFLDLAFCQIVLHGKFGKTLFLNKTILKKEKQTSTRAFSMTSLQSNLVIANKPTTIPNPLGGTDPERFDPREAWYPIAYIQDLNPAKLTSFTLLGQDLVIWHDANAEAWRVFEDRCPHRLAPLSQGRVNEAGYLECPYHGWAFSGEGNCEVIPQQIEGGQAQQSKRACVAALPTSIQQGLLFAYPGNPAHAERVEVPIVPLLEDSPQDWVCIDTFRDLPYDALTLLENVLDSSHLPFTHHQSVGNRANASPVELEVVESGKGGFKGIWEEGPRRGTLGRQETTFIAPGLMWHDLTSKQFGRTLTVVYATPMRKGECRLFARFPFKFSSKLPAFFLKLTPRWYSHINQNAILEDDQIFLHFQERYLEAAGGGANLSKAFYLPTKADLFVFEFRSWVNRYSADPFLEAQLSPPLRTEKLLDRYHSHTSKCASCRTALMRIQQVRFGCAVLAAIAWVGLPLAVFFLPRHDWPIPVGLSVAIALVGGTWFALGQWERKLYQGREIPPRNQ